MNNIDDTIKELEKKKEDALAKLTKNEVEMKKKIDETSFDSKAKIDKLTKEISVLENELHTLANYQKGNSKINTLLYNLCVEILSKIQKDKLLLAEKQFGKFTVSKEQFTCEIFDNKNFMDLIADNLSKASSNGKGSALLRQTIAFSNSEVRQFLPSKEYLRFDLVNTLKELKNLYDKQEFDIYKLKCVIQNLKQNEGKNKQTTKELNNEVKLLKLKYNSLLNKVNRQFKIEKQEQAQNEEKFNVGALNLNTKRIQAATQSSHSKKFFLTSQKIKAKEDKNKLLNIKSAEHSFDESESQLSEESSDDDKNKNYRSVIKRERHQKMAFTEKDFKKFKDISFK